MVDLYSSLFYKIRFTIEAKDKESDLLWKIVFAIRQWMTNKHNYHGTVNLSDNIHDWSALKTMTGGQIIGKDIRIVSENCLVEEPFNSSFWACRISEFQKHDGVAPRQWVTDIGVEPIEKGEMVFSCIISYSDRPGFVGECEATPVPTIPKIVKMLWQDPELICKNGIDTLDVVPRKLKPGDFLHFWERIKDSERWLPYIYISPRNFSETGSPLFLNPQALSIALGGNAIVYYADNLGVTEEMNYFCPEAYKCYDGSLRIYYPQLDETQPNDSFRHRFISSKAIEEKGEEHTIQMLRRAIVQSISSCDDYFRIEDCHEKRNSLIRRKRLEELKKLHLQEMQSQKDKHSEALQQIQDEKLDVAIEEEQKRLVAEEKASQLENDNKQLREENYNLSIENDSYRGLAKENADLRRACNSRLAIKEYPENAEALAQYFENVFGEKIAFSEDANKSIKECSISMTELWRVFFALATIMCDLFSNGNGDIFKEFRQKSGIDVSRGEGMMTRQSKKLMRQYETEYHGETIDIEPHITYSKIGQSIHFGFSEKDQKVIVGWCGEHKDNYTSRKVH